MASKRAWFSTDFGPSTTAEEQYLDTGAQEVRRAEYAALLQVRAYIDLELAKRQEPERPDVIHHEGDEPAPASGERFGDVPAPRTEGS